MSDPSSTTSLQNSAIAASSRISPKLTVEDREEESRYVAKLASENIRYQQLWSNVEEHQIEISTDSSFAPSLWSNSVPTTYTMTILTAIPPKRLFVEDKVPTNYKEGKNDSGDRVKIEGDLYKEFILPCITEQEWSIREWVQVFNEIDKIWEHNMTSDTTSKSTDPDESKESNENNGEDRNQTESRVSKFLPDYKPKRLIMACVTNDGTVVYYVINRGITPPRRN